MLATQLAMTHITLGKSAQLLDQNYSDVQTINSLGNLYTKLSRLGIDLYASYSSQMNSNRGTDMLTVIR
jgi:hypothetical protein